MAKLTLGLVAGLGCLLAVTPASSLEAKTGMERLKEAQTEFRVCATPNNLPFTNKAGGGFDNKIAELIASKEGKPLSYAWAEQTHAFFRQTLGAWECDVVMSARWLRWPGCHNQTLLLFEICRAPQNLIETCRRGHPHRRCGEDSPA